MQMLCMRKCCADAVSAGASANVAGACYAASVGADAVSVGYAAGVNADAVSAGYAAGANADAVSAGYVAGANADAVSAGAMNAATKHGMLVQCSVMHAEARRSRKCDDATRQVGCSSKLAQQGLRKD